MLGGISTIAIRYAPITLMTNGAAYRVNNTQHKAAQLTCYVRVLPGRWWVLLRYLQTRQVRIRVPRG